MYLEMNSRILTSLQQPLGEMVPTLNNHSHGLRREVLAFESCEKMRPAFLISAHEIRQPYVIAVPQALGDFHFGGLYFNQDMGVSLFGGFKWKPRGKSPRETQRGGYIDYGL